MKRSGEIRWRAVALGWLIAACSGVVISPVLRLLYGLVVELPAQRGVFTTAVVVVSLLSGFLAHLFGGYAAGRWAGVSGGLNGAMTAVLGLALGMVLAVILAASFGALFTEGVALPPSGFGIRSAALTAGLVLFAVNLFGGFVGGELGEPVSGTGTFDREKGP